MDIIGERWALPVMRELMLGPRRFGELKTSLHGISANVLTQRLEGLEAAGIVQRARLPPPASVQVYGLTQWGYEAGPIFQAMGRWAVKSPGHDPTRPFSAVSLMLSFRTMMDLERIRGLRARIGFRFGEQSFVLVIDDGRVDLARGPIEGVDLAFTGATEATAAIAGAAYGGVPLRDVEATGALKIEGDRALAERFVTLFPMPAKAPAPD
ncbi:MAG: winged helix-turn-helix transcriptional regulator [Allosphingosinicella sp.]